MIAPHFRVGADERHAFMQCLRNHRTIERVGMIRKIGQRGDRFDVIAADRQLRESGESERRARVARMNGQVAFAVFDRDLPDRCGTDVQDVIGIFDQCGCCRRELRCALGSPERDVRIEQQLHGASPCSSKSAAIDSSPALNASTVVGMSRSSPADGMCDRPAVRRPRRFHRLYARQFPLPRATRRALTDSARPSSTFTLSSHAMHASVMLWP